jgi:hypothetical protein
MGDNTKLTVATCELTYANTTGDQSTPLNGGESSFSEMVGNVTDNARRGEESSHEQGVAPAVDIVKVGEKLTEKQQRRKALLPFAIISISYLLYTMTDGSVRMIVLLHAYNKKFTAMEVISVMNYES